MNTFRVDTLTIVLFGISGLLLIASAASWLKLARDGNRARQAIPINAFRSAAGLTGATFIMLAISACWLAFMFISASS